MSLLLISTSFFNFRKKNKPKTKHQIPPSPPPPNTQKWLHKTMQTKNQCICIAAEQLTSSKKTPFRDPSQYFCLGQPRGIVFSWVHPLPVSSFQGKTVFTRQADTLPARKTCAVWKTKAVLNKNLLSNITVLSLLASWVVLKGSDNSI